MVRHTLPCSCFSRPMAPGAISGTSCSTTARHRLPLGKGMVVSLGGELRWVGVLQTRHPRRTGRGRDRESAVASVSCLPPTQTSGNRQHAVETDRPADRPHSGPSFGTGRLLAGQISVCSAISNASSTSMPRYRTVDSSLWPEVHRLDYLPCRTMSRTCRTP